MINVGLSGFSYKPWQGEGRFYPADLKTSQFLPYYAERFNVVEMDGSWYKMPATTSIATYIRQSPEDFKFSFKMHRKVTHMARLKEECLDSLVFFLSRLAPLAVAGKCGPILVQLPPNLKADVDRLSKFAKLLPANFSEEVKIQPKWAIEFRNATWNQDPVAEIMAEHNIAYVMSETDEMEGVWRDTADFVYARLRKSEYSDDDLKSLTNKFLATSKPCTLFCKHEDDGSPWIWAHAIQRLAAH